MMDFQCRRQERKSDAPCAQGTRRERILRKIESEPSQIARESETDGRRSVQACRTVQQIENKISVALGLLSMGGWNKHAARKPIPGNHKGTQAEVIARLAATEIRFCLHNFANCVLHKFRNAVRSISVAGMTDSIDTASPRSRLSATKTEQVVWGVFFMRATGHGMPRRSRSGRPRSPPVVTKQLVRGSTNGRITARWRPGIF